MLNRRPCGLGNQRPRVIGQSEGAAEGVAEKAHRPIEIGAREILIDIQPGQQIRRDVRRRRAVELLDLSSTISQAKAKSCFAFAYPRPIYRSEPRIRVAVKRESRPG